MVTAQPQTRCVQNLVSASVSATSREVLSVGGRERVYVAGRELQPMAKNKAPVHQKLIAQPQTQSVQSLDSASVSATSLEMKSAGGRERVSVVG